MSIVGKSQGSIKHIKSPWKDRFKDRFIKREYVSPLKPQPSFDFKQTISTNIVFQRTLGYDIDSSLYLTFSTRGNVTLVKTCPPFMNIFISASIHVVQVYNNPFYGAFKRISKCFMPLTCSTCINTKPRPTNVLVAQISPPEKPNPVCATVQLAPLHCPGRKGNGKKKNTYF